MGPERKSMVMTEGRKARDGVSRVRPCRGRRDAARHRPGPQGDGDAAWPCAGRDLAVARATSTASTSSRCSTASPSCSAVAWPKRSSERYLDRRLQRLRACDRHGRDMVTRYGMSPAPAPWSMPRTRARSSSAAASRAPPASARPRSRRWTPRSAASSTSSTPAKQIIETNRDKIEAMTDALMKWETIDRDQVLDIMAGRPPRAPGKARPQRSDRRRRQPQHQAGQRPSSRLKPVTPTKARSDRAFFHPGPMHWQTRRFRPTSAARA